MEAAWLSSEENVQWRGRRLAPPRFDVVVGSDRELQQFAECLYEHLSERHLRLLADPRRRVGAQARSSSATAYSDTFGNLLVDGGGALKYMTQSHVTNSIAPSVDGTIKFESRCDLRGDLEVSGDANGCGRLMVAAGQDVSSLTLKVADFSARRSRNTFASMERLRRISRGSFRTSRSAGTQAAGSMPARRKNHSRWTWGGRVNRVRAAASSTRSARGRRFPCLPRYRRAPSCLPNLIRSEGRVPNMEMCRT